VGQVARRACAAAIQEGASASSSRIGDDPAKKAQLEECTAKQAGKVMPTIAPAERIAAVAQEDEKVSHPGHGSLFVGC